MRKMSRRQQLIQRKRKEKMIRRERAKAFAEVTDGCGSNLPNTREAMVDEMAAFSKSFDRKHYANAMKIYESIGGRMPQVSSWEVYDQAFSWPKMRKYDVVEVEMDNLEHFQANLNKDPTNSRHLEQLIEYGLQARAQFDHFFKNGYYVDPTTGPNPAPSHPEIAHDDLAEED